jgi:beta-hydroxylase
MKITLLAVLVLLTIHVNAIRGYDSKIGVLGLRAAQIKQLEEKVKEQETIMSPDNPQYIRKKQEVEALYEAYNGHTPDEIECPILDPQDEGWDHFYEPSSHPEIKRITDALVANFDDIESDLFNILNKEDFTTWPEDINITNGWVVFGLWAFGLRVPQNVGKCPKIEALIKKLIPERDISTVTFTSLRPGGYISPHKGPIGYSEHMLRIHMPVIVPIPNEKQGIQVGGLFRKYKRGEPMVFDDSMMHSAWNFSNQTRINLMLDFKFYDKMYVVDPMVSNVADFMYEDENYKRIFKEYLPPKH